MMQKISIKLAGKPYEFSIEAKNEEKIRAVVARLNSQIDSYCKQYKGIEVQDALSIILLQREIAFIDLEAKEEIKETLERLQSLDDRLGDYLLSR